MSTLRVSNIEAKADASSPTIDEKVKVTSSQGRVLVQIDGKTAGITSIGINTTSTSFTIDGNQNVQFVGIITAANLNTTGVTTFNSGIVVSSGSASAPSISPSGDSNTGIFFPAADTIAFAEGGVEAVRLDSSGRLGIGTANPVVPLDIFKSSYPEINLRTGTVTATFGIDTGTNFVAFGPTSSHDLKLYTSGVSRLNVDSSGRVTKPYQPAFLAWLNTSSTTVNVGNTFPFNATVFNVGSYFDTSTNPGRFTAPVSGYYLFGCTVGDDDGSEFVGKIVTFYKNGGVYRDIIEGIPTPNAHFEFHQTTLMQLNVGDYADVRMRSGSVTLNGGSDGPAFRNAFYGYLLG
jgi:hypothetical protein